MRDLHIENINLIEEIKGRIEKHLEESGEIDDYLVAELIEKEVFELSSEKYMSIDEKRYISRSVFNSIRRLDVIQPLIDDVNINEIMVNGYKDIFVERKGLLEKTNIKFDSNEKLMDIIQIIVSKVNRIVNESSPIVDARLEDGSRVNIVLPPIAIDGPILTIRKFPEERISVDSLINYGTLTPECAVFLERLVKKKYNIIISGGTSSGKTTMLNILSSMIDRDERIITIEDSAELQLSNIDNLVRLETRNMNSEDKGEIKIRDLIKTSLRMRPERIIVGEVRGEEALDMISAMNTGHEGSLSTGHANSAMDMLRRLETMIISGVDLPVEVIRKNIAASVDVVMHLSRIKGGKRKIVEISEICGVENGIYTMNEIYKLDENKNLVCTGKLKNEKI